MTKVDKWHDEKRPDRWVFTLGIHKPGKFTSYELALCEDIGNGVEVLNGQAPSGVNVFWTVYGSKDGIVQAIRDFDNIHDALALLVSMDVIAESQKQYVETAWMEDAEGQPVDFETVSGVLREARDLIVVLREHLAHATATVGDIRRADKMVGEIDALDL